MERPLAPGLDAYTPADFPVSGPIVQWIVLPNPTLTAGSPLLFKGYSYR